MVTLSSCNVKGGIPSSRRYLPTYLGPIALLVVPACPLRVCALALPRRPLPPPWVVWRAHLARSRHWALVGPFDVVRAPPRVLPWSLAPSGVLGGGRSSPSSPLPGLGLCAPRGAGPWRSCAGGLVRGGGGGPCAVPPVCAAGGASKAGGHSASFHPSAFPGQATKRVSLASFWSRGAWPPYCSRSCSPAFSGRDLCGVLARWRGLTCSPWFLWEPAAGAGGAGRAPAPLSGRGRGDHPLCLGGVGNGAPAACEPSGGGGGAGGSRRGLPAPPLVGGPRYPTLVPILSSAHSPPPCALSRGRGPAPGGGRCGAARGPLSRGPRQT